MSEAGRQILPLLLISQPSCACYFRSFFFLSPKKRLELSLQAVYIFFSKHGCHTLYRIYVQGFHLKMLVTCCICVHFAACPPGSYKMSSRQQECFPCPANSVAEEDGSVVCMCKEDHFRTPLDTPSAPCTSNPAVQCCQKFDV